MHPLLLQLDARFGLARSSRCLSFVRLAAAAAAGQGGAASGHGFVLQRNLKNRTLDEVIIKLELTHK